MYKISPKKGIGVWKLEKFLKTVSSPVCFVIHKNGLLDKKGLVQLIEKSKTSDRKINSKLESLKQKVQGTKFEVNNELFLSVSDISGWEQFLESSCLYYLDLSLNVGEGVDACED